MRKLLEALVDENGHLTLYTDFEFYDAVENPAPSKKAAKKQLDSISRMAIEGMVPVIWRDRNYRVSKAIRYLSQAEVITCAEPYDNAEHLWSALMFDYIPHYEKFADGLKIPYGYDPSRIIRPIIGGNGLSAIPFSNAEELFSIGLPTGSSFPPSGFPGFGGKGFGSGGKFS